MSNKFRQERQRQRELAARRRDPLSMVFDINEWLKDGNRLVTRKDMYDFVTRLEVGKRMRGRWQSRLRRLGRRIWGWLTFNPFVDVEDPIYRPGFPTSQKRSPNEQLANVPEGADRRGGGADPSGGTAG